MPAEASHAELHPPTPEDGRWAAGLANAETRGSGHRRAIAKSRRFDRATAVVLGVAVVLIYATLSMLLTSRSSFFYVLGLGAVVAWAQARSRRPATMWLGSTLAGLVYTGVWSMFWFAQWPSFRDVPAYLVGTFVGGPLAGWSMALALNGVYWGASVLRWWLSSESDGAVQQTPAEQVASPSTVHISIYSVPRRFDVATLLTVSFAYSILFTFLKLLDSHWSVFAFIGGLTITVAMGQMLARSDKEIRNASFVAGALYTLIWCLVVVVASQMWGEGVLLLVFCFVAGPMLGYVTGVVDAGVFLVADLVRKRME